MNSRKALYRAIIASVGTLLAGASAGAAHAATQNNQQPVTVLGRPDALVRIVPFGDLALATKAGRNSLERRVSDAVGEVCPDSEAGRSMLEPFYDAQDCRTFAWTRARPQIREAIALARSGQLLAMTIEVSSAG
jgi:UrcA family protein